MGIILSHGRVNIFNLAKNAYTSVEQIEPFYAKHVPLSHGMAKDLQRIGAWLNQHTADYESQRRWS
jgi:hypothetical protein